MSFEGLYDIEAAYLDDDRAISIEELERQQLEVDFFENEVRYEDTTEIESFFDDLDI